MATVPFTLPFTLGDSAQGSASGSYTWSSSATGQRTPKASAAGAYGWAGTATGVTPVAGVSDGSASGAYGWSSTATGKHTPKASASGAYGWVGTAVGQVPGNGIAFPASGTVLTLTGLSFNLSDYMYGIFQGKFSAAPYTRMEVRYPASMAPNTISEGVKNLNTAVRTVAGRETRCLPQPGLAGRVALDGPIRRR